MPVHRCSTSARPSLRCADALASTGLAFERRVCRNPGPGLSKSPVKRASSRSTLLALQSVHCSPRCPSIAVVHLCVYLFAARMHSRRLVWVASDVCEAELVKITGQTNNMQKTVLVQNEALEWSTTCFPRKAFWLIFGTNTVGSLYKIELVLVPGRLLWYRTKMCPIRNVTQQGALARNCPSKAPQARLHPDIKT